MDETELPSKKRKLGAKHRLALLEVIARKQLADRINFGALGAKHGISAESLRQVWSLFSRGRVDLGVPETATDRHIDSRIQNERCIALLKNYFVLMLDTFEATLYACQDATTRGNKKAFKEKGMPGILNELKKCIEVRKLAEQGYNAILEEEMLKRRGEEKSLNGNGAEREAPMQIVTPEDEQRGLAALEDGMDDDERRGLAALMGTLNGS